MLCTSVETKPSMKDWSDNIAAKSLQLCPTLCDPIDGSPPGSCPWDSSGNNTGVGCHFLLQCMKVKVKSLSRVQLLATPWTVAFQAPLSMDSPGKNPGVGCHFLLQGIFPIQGSNPCLRHLLHWQADSFTTDPAGEP